MGIYVIYVQLVSKVVTYQNVLNYYPNKIDFLDRETNVSKLLFVVKKIE